MKLKKELALIDVYSLITGSIIGASLFLLPGLAHARVGNAFILCYILASLLAATSMLSMAELVSAMPKAGGDYFVVKRVLGPAIGTITGILSWFFLSQKSALALYGISLFSDFLPNVDIHVISVGLTVIFVIINILGVKEAGRTQVLLTFLLLFFLLSFTIRGFWAMDIRRFGNFAPYGLLPVFGATGFIFVTYGGILKCVAVAGEIKTPGKTIPLAMILSLLTVTLIYVFAVFVTAGVLDPSEYHESDLPLNFAAQKFMGPVGSILMALAAMLAFVTTANGGFMSASRYPLALSRDGLFPQVFSRINSRFRTPHVAILVTGAFIIVSLFLKLEYLAKAASTFLILTYIVANSCLLIIRESRIQNYQPTFRCPLYPWMQIFGIIGYVFILYQMGLESLIITFALALIGFMFYWFYGRARTEKEYALLHLVDRIIDKNLSIKGQLENELKEIIREREGMTRDRFDELVEKCNVLDLDKPMNMEELYKIVSDVLSQDIKLPQQSIFDKLIAREQDTPTVISPTIAIPHIIIEGEHVFDIVLVRSKSGIRFSETAQNIHTVFVLIGTRDERNFHLRALSSIAQIIHNPQFEKKWMSAKNDQALRDIILLGGRKRYL
ncbi:amino acid permease [Candidatus Sumerlaeota bacterium]|nr:amino acid permease [Candidatus Sumerlaeota bacterium]